MSSPTCQMLSASLHNPGTFTTTSTSSNMLTFDVILEDQWTKKLTFATIEECVDIDDLVNHIHECFPSHTIEQIKQK
jgi:hypothetical protein